MAIYPIEDIQVTTGEKAMSVKYNKLCADAVNSTDDIHPQYPSIDYFSDANKVIGFDAKIFINSGGIGEQIDFSSYALDSIVYRVKMNIDGKELRNN